jgi:hypothetical protein
VSRILIPEYLCHATIATVRSLARGGDVCEIAWPDPGGRRPRWIRSWGRFVSKVHDVEDPFADGERFADRILDLCHERDIDAVIPVTFEDHSALSRRAGSLRGRPVTLLPTPEHFEIASDGIRTLQHARAAGVACPLTWPVAGDGDLRVAASHATFPVVLKTRDARETRRCPRYAGSREELVREYAAWVSKSEPGERSALIQEYVPGYTHDACAVGLDGEVVQMLTQVRKLTYPVSGGVGAVNFTTHSPDLERVARPLLESLRWNGPVQLEFKLDSRDGTFKLIEINPRLWGTLDLSIKAGIDFPVLIRDLILGRDVERDRPYPPGVRYRFLFEREIFARLQLARSLGVPATRDPQRYSRTFRDLDPADPLPDLHRVRVMLKTLLTEGISGVAGRIPDALVSRIDRVLPEQYGDRAAHPGQ